MGGTLTFIWQRGIPLGATHWGTNIAGFTLTNCLSDGDLCNEGGVQNGARAQKAPEGLWHGGITGPQTREHQRAAKPPEEVSWPRRHHSGRGMGGLLGHRDAIRVTRGVGKLART